MVRTLWKNTKAAHVELAKLANYLTVGMDMDVHFGIGIKNAYAALSKQQFDASILLFLISGRPLDAVDVCFNKKKDLCLGILVFLLCREQENFIQSISSDYLHEAMKDLPSATIKLLSLKIMSPDIDFFTLWKVVFPMCAIIFRLIFLKII